MENNLRKNNLYETDFYLWTQQQAEYLKKGSLEKLDHDNLIEEMEDLGKSQKSRLKSHLKNLLMHMLKAKYQPEMKTVSWEISINNARAEAREALEESPSLKSKIPVILKSAYSLARGNAAIETGLKLKNFPEECPWIIEEILKE
jgi:uncharacterized protein DUF29